jgi:hypothetical protein
MSVNNLFIIEGLSFHGRMRPRRPSLNAAARALRPDLPTNGRSGPTNGARAR